MTKSTRKLNGVVLGVFMSSMIVAMGAAAEVVKAGAGSYLRGLPSGVKGPPGVIYKTAEVSAP